MSDYVNEVLLQSVWAIDSNLKYKLEEKEELAAKLRRVQHDTALLVFQRQDLVAEIKSRGVEVPISKDANGKPLLSPLVRIDRLSKVDESGAIHVGDKPVVSGEGKFSTKPSESGEGTFS